MRSDKTDSVLHMIRNIFVCLGNSVTLLNIISTNTVPMEVA